MDVILPAAPWPWGQPPTEKVPVIFSGGGRWSE